MAWSRGSTPRDGEEACLHDGVDARAHAGVARHLVGVDDIELQLLGDDLLLHFARQLGPHHVGAEGRVEEKHRARSGPLEDIVLLEEHELMAADEARAPDEIGRTEVARPEAQERDRDGARLLGIVDEVALRVVLGFLADDLDGVLVGAHRAVGAEAEEDGAHYVLPSMSNSASTSSERCGDVVDDADGEVAACGCGRASSSIDRLDHRRGEFLRGQSVARRR